MTGENARPPAEPWPSGGGEMARLIRQHDWTGSPLGTIRGWPQSLRTVVDLILGAPTAMIVLWGRDLCQVYNDAYRVVMGDKHPAGLGRPTRECWPELQATSGPVHAAVLAGESRAFKNRRLIVRRRGAEEEAWFDLTYSPLRDEAGEIAGILLTVVETTGEVQAEDRFRRILDTDTLGVLFFDRDGVLIDANDVFLRRTGYSREEVEARSLDWKSMTPPEWYEVSEQQLQIFAATGHIGPYQKQYVNKDGSRTWMLFAGSDLGDGTLGEFALDIEDQKRTEAALRESERRLRTLIEGLPQLVWRAREPAQWVWSSPQWTRFTGLSEDESRGEGWLDALHPEDRKIALDAWRKAKAEDGFQADYRLFEQATGAHRWFRNRATPSHDEHGKIVEWFGTSTDVDELRRLHEEQRALVAELQHRVRNTLGVIRSIARRTAETATTSQDYATHLEGRIDAFGRVQAAVTRSPLGGVDLAELVADELLAHATREGDGADMEGPDVRLQPKAAETFGLVVHELATNAVKYGALAVPGGHVSVRWRTEDGLAPRLVFEWKERAAALRPSGPTRRGFGMDLLDNALSYQLKARATRIFEADGLRCTIEVPLTPRVVVAEAPGLEAP